MSIIPDELFINKPKGLIPDELFTEKYSEMIDSAFIERSKDNIIDFKSFINELEVVGAINKPLLYGYLDYRVKINKRAREGEKEMTLSECLKVREDYFPKGFSHES